MKRQDFFEHVAWTGSGILWSLSAAGTLVAGADAAERSSFSFVQISDSHIGFTRPENPDVRGTLAKTVDGINALPQQPAFVMHTGDVTHLSKPAQFDDAKSLLGTLRAAVGRAENPRGWFAFDQGGIHFLSLVNVFNFEIDGKLGEEQLAFVERDLAAQKRSTPIVVFAHVPLYALYPQWGWTTEDGARVLVALRRFDAATVLNGHIHQVVAHVDGNIRFATAASTAYPQPAPGTADKPGPLKVPEGHLLGVLGFRTVQLDRTPSLIDRSLA
jgi:Icc protein